MKCVLTNGVHGKLHLCLEGKSSSQEIQVIQIYKSIFEKILKNNIKCDSFEIIDDLVNCTDHIKSLLKDHLNFEDEQILNQISDDFIDIY